ncbi:Ku protein [Ectobacillus ponti]|uniref:Non-homologous end joining protein Ku n=1 Tax=Ectobacillus ponti TaxID=2961894 RepID=A0AA42BP21_9BACI|nr:Ku protein [Ectobacillus ponti]MCP8968620.1 Ku protein [Ectobacillus ponti]
MHTVWKGNLTFGLVSIGIKLHSAVEEKDVKLISIHKDCLVPIRHEKIAPGCDDDAIEPEDIVKAYEYGPHQYVILNNNELDALKKEYEVKAVDIMSFVQLEEIDPVYFDRSYFISPTPGSEKAYLLLRQALERTGKIGLVKISLRSRQHLAIIRVLDDCLILETIHYPDEVRTVDQVPNLPDADQFTIQTKELVAAITLVNQLTVRFDPEAYQDEYRSALLDLIELKIEQEDIVKPVINPNRDLGSIMEALSASIEQTKPAPKKPARTKKASL